MKRPDDMARAAARAAAWIRPESMAGIERYVRGQLQPDGGFRGRSPASDLYYTAFGLDCLAALNVPLPEESIRRFLAAIERKEGLHGIGTTPSTAGPISSKGLPPSLRQLWWTGLRAGPSQEGIRNESFQANKFPSLSSLRSRYYGGVGEGAGVGSHVRPDSAPAGDGLDFVHLAAGARCWGALSGPSAAARGRVWLRRMEDYRAADGGYHHREKRAARGTVYGGFLAFLACERLGAGLPEPEKLLAAVRALRTQNGGCANAASIATGTTTATSAALLLGLWIAGETDEAAIRALQECECRSGGYLAFRGAPGPDLLSTATALYALRAAGRPPDAPAAHGAFVESLWDDSGGFRGHPNDPLTDCEYTFYALLALGACVDPAPVSPPPRNSKFQNPNSKE